MKIFLTTLAILVFKIALGQIYYNKSIGFDSANLYNGYTNLIIDNDEIYSIGGNYINNGQGLYLDKLDNSANLSNRITIKMDSFQMFGGQGQNSLLKIKKNFYSLGVLTDNNQVNNGWFVKFSEDLDTVFTQARNIVNSAGTTYRYSIKKNNNIITLGDVGYYNNSLNFIFGQVYLVKFDTLANIIWEHEYGSPQANEFVKGMYPAADGGFFIYGYKTNYQQYSQCYLLKVDSMGNQQWQRTWGDVYWDGLLGLYEMPNGNLLVSGYMSDDFFGLEVNWPYLAMLTPDGSQRIWEKRFFNSIDHYRLTNIFANQDGTFHIWGDESTPYITRALLMHFSANFDSLDTKFYSYWNGAGAQNYIRDIVKMPDQGYVACGFGWDNTHDEDGWLLRIDSNGCANVNCAPLAVQEVKINTEKFILAPNPTTDKITIQGNNNVAIKTISVYDLTGHVIDVPINNRELDITQLQNGMYIIEVTDINGNIQRLKALKA